MTYSDIYILTKYDHTKDSRSVEYMVRFLVVFIRESVVNVDKACPSVQGCASVLLCIDC